MASRRVVADWLKRVLQEQSLHVYHPEYDGYLFTHIQHGVIALYLLGADESRVNQFISSFKTKNKLQKLTQDDQALPVQELLGKRESYRMLLDYYDKLAENSGDEVVKNSFPKLGLGVSSGLLHGWIQLGYGCSVGSLNMMTEGLAYLHYAYEPLAYDDTRQNSIENFGKGKTPVLNALQKLRNDIQLREKVESFHKEFNHLNLGFLEPRLIGINRYLANHFIQLAHDIELPNFFTTDCDLPGIIKLVNWLNIQIITVYCLSETVNDFVMIHGITGCWALRQMAPFLRKEDAVLAFRNFTAEVLAVYMLTHCSSLSRSVPRLDGPLDEIQWQSIINGVLSMDADEHVFKLTQVCYCLWKEEGMRGPDYDPLYVCAINIVTQNPFGFVQPSDK